MKTNAQRRDPKRFSKILSKLLQAWPAQVDHQPIPIEVDPLKAIPKPVLNRAVLPRPRRAKGVPKARDEGHIIVHTANLEMERYCRI
jgi:hypothetical protein